MAMQWHGNGTGSDGLRLAKTRTDGREEVAGPSGGHDLVH